MHIVRDLSELPAPCSDSVVTIGNFDGVHLAHQKLLQRVAEVAPTARAAATALTFDPHPSKVLARERAAKLLTPLDQKIELIEKLGIERLVVIPFTRELSLLSPTQFVQEILVKKLRAVSVVVGPNFRFGHRQAGDVNILADLARQKGFQLEIVPILEVRREQVSSSRIRELLSEGQVHRACRLLGRPFSVTGSIVPGLGVGRSQTVPTLNLAPVEGQLPKIGVYITRTRLGETWHDSVTNVGHKPTFGEHRLTVESFLLSFAGEIHAPEMEIEFLHRLRDEMKFPTPAALKEQIHRDAGRALKFFRRLKLFRERSVRRLAPTTRTAG